MLVKSEKIHVLYLNFIISLSLVEVLRCFVSYSHDSALGVVASFITNWVTLGLHHAGLVVVCTYFFKVRDMVGGSTRIMFNPHSFIVIPPE